MIDQERFSQLIETRDRVKHKEVTSKSAPQVIVNITIDKRRFTQKYFQTSPPQTDVQLEKGGITMNEIRKQKFSMSPRLKVDRHLLALVKNRARTGSRVSIKRMKEITSKIKGSMSDSIVEERNRERW